MMMMIYILLTSASIVGYSYTGGIQNLLQQATLLPQEEQMDSEEMARFIQQSGLSPSTKCSWL